MAVYSENDPVDRKKIVYLLIILTLLLVSAVIILPSGLVKLAAIGLLIAPLLFFFFDRPVLILYFLIFVLFSELHIFTNIPVIKLVTVILILSFTVECVRGRRVLVHDKVFFILTVAMLILAFQSMALARDIDSSFSRINLFVRYIVYIFFIIQFSTNRKEFITLLCLITFAGALSEFLPFAFSPPEQYADMSLMWGEGVFRYEGYVREANMFAFAVNFLIPILFLLLVKVKKPRFMRPLMTILIGGSIFVLFLSFSRGGFIGLVFMFLTLLVMERKNKTVLLTGLILIVTAVAFAPSVYLDRIATIFDVGSKTAKDFSVLSRMETMRIALILGFKNPIFGIGIENFLFYVSRYVAFSDVVHNAPLQILSDLGWVALFVFSAIIIYNFRVLKRLIGCKDDPEVSQIGRFLFIQHVAVLVNSMTLPVAYHLILWITLSFPTIAVYAYRRRLPESPS